MSNETSNKQPRGPVAATQVDDAIKVLSVGPRVVTQQTLTKLQAAGASSDLIDVVERAVRKG
ncbi:MAG TPA: hypothetical protein VHR65_03220 [Solirubrobacterales bacterium]|jgi:hypothetical protein|nr:hypothetical protein [Solirubrobacterales bacterium]